MYLNGIVVDQAVLYIQPKPVIDKENGCANVA